jgi:hypothetical protein
MGADKFLSAFGRAAAELEVEADDEGTIPTVATDVRACLSAGFESTTRGGGGGGGGGVVRARGAACLSNDDINVAGVAFFLASSSSARLRFQASKRSLRCRIFSSSDMGATGGVACALIG